MRMSGVAENVKVNTSEKESFLTFNNMVIGFIFPLGFTSIMTAFSEFWIQELLNIGNITPPHLPIFEYFVQTTS